MLVALALVIGGAGAAWGLWSFARINRVDLELAEAENAEPRNFLVVGSDSRDGISSDDPDAAVMVGGDLPGGQRADSLMVVRVDPRAERVDLLSVPRDLWVELGPDGKHQRINAAYSRSAQDVVDVVQHTLGIPIHHFVEVDFRGFQSLVDALGGVPMYFEHAVRDRSSGLEIPQRGCAVLDGYQGLAFARARHLEWNDDGVWHSDPTGDLGRATRQQLLTRAAMARAQSMGIGDVGKLRRLVEAHTTDGGASVVLLDEVAAEPVLRIFRGDTSSAPVTTTTAPPPEPGQIVVDVHNGSGVDGEARRVSWVLDSGGFGIGEVATATGSWDRTTIAHAPGGEEMARLVGRWLTPAPELVEDDELAAGTVRVTIGADFEHVVEPGSEADAGDDGSTGAEAPSAPSTPSTTTTTQPGWVPGTPPAGVSCP